MEKWVVTAKKADFEKIGQTFGIDPVIARLIRNRDVEGMENIRSYLYGTLEELPSPWLLKDMKKAVEILKSKIDQKARIRIIGDYDIDGVTSTYILLTGFRRLGAKVDTYIPDRIKDGYGMHSQLIEKAAEDRIDTIVTCDNGIAASAEIEQAKEQGMTVVVTDHHEIPYRDTEKGREWIIPEADAVINPKQPDCPYPNKNICGAVVAWKLIWALYETYGIDRKEILDFSEPAAVATVGDVMDLQGENRIIVKEGLKRLPVTKNQGFRALIEANGLSGERITAYHVGFCAGTLYQCQRKAGYCGSRFEPFVYRECGQSCKRGGRSGCFESEQKSNDRKRQRRGRAYYRKSGTFFRPCSGSLSSRMS